MKLKLSISFTFQSCGVKCRMLSSLNCLRRGLLCIFPDLYDMKKRAGFMKGLLRRHLPVL